MNKLTRTLLAGTIAAGLAGCGQSTEEKPTLYATKGTVVSITPVEKEALGGTTTAFSAILDNKDCITSQSAVLRATSDKNRSYRAMAQASLSEGWVVEVHGTSDQAGCYKIQRMQYLK